MFHLVGNFQTRAGDALAGYFVKLKDAAGAYATLYSDANSTPIATVSGIANTGLTDAEGMYDIWVADGTYDVELYDKNNSSLLLRTQNGVQMFSGALASSAYDLAASATATAEASEATALASAATADAAAANVTKRLPGVTAYGSVASTGAASTTLAAAYSAQGVGGTVVADADFSTGSTAPDNPGVAIIGSKTAWYAPTTTGSGGFVGGGRVINKPGREPSLRTFGQETLIPRFLNRLKAGSSINIALAGDSNTIAYSGPVLAGLLTGLSSNITVNNFGVSGTDVHQWITNTGGISGTGKDLTSVLATLPDLLVIRYATNSPYYGRDAASYLASLETALSTIRASANGSVQQLSIVVCSGHPMNDAAAMAVESGEKRDERYNARIRPGIMALCEKYQCCFSDCYGRFPDAFVDFASGPAQNSMLDAARVHAQNALIDMIAQAVYEDIVPSVYRSGASIPNPPGGTVIKLVTDAPNTYPKGFSIYRASAGWPINGFVHTVHPADGQYPMQYNFGFSGEAYLYVRNSSGAAPGTWGAWRLIGQVTTAVASFGSGFSNGFGVEALGVTLDGADGIISGYIGQTAAAITAGQTLCTLPTGNRPPSGRPQDIFVWAWDGTGVRELLPAIIATTGVITTTKASTSTTVQRVYFNTRFVRG